MLQNQTAVAQSGGLLIGNYDLYGLEGGLPSAVTLEAGGGAPPAADAIAAVEPLPVSLVDTVALDATAR